MTPLVHLYLIVEYSLHFKKTFIYLNPFKTFNGEVDSYNQGTELLTSQIERNAS